MRELTTQTLIKHEVSTAALAQSPNLISGFSRLTPHMVLFRREHFVEKEIRAIDGFGSYWAVAFLDSKNEQLGFCHRRKNLFLNGLHFIFIPPHSIIEWILKPGVLSWSALASDLPLPPSIPTQPFAVSCDPSLSLRLNQPEDIFQMIATQREHAFPISKENNINTVSLRCKQFIDHGYAQPDRALLREFSRMSGVAEASVSRAFKTTYGISPTRYKNTLRSFQALWILVSQSRSTGEVSQELGFHDYSHFQKLFSQRMGMSPKKYKSLDSNLEKDQIPHL